MHLSRHSMMCRFCTPISPEYPCFPFSSRTFLVKAKAALKCVQVLVFICTCVPEMRYRNELFFTNLTGCSWIGNKFHSTPRLYRSTAINEGRKPQKSKEHVHFEKRERQSGYNKAHFNFARS